MRGEEGGRERERGKERGGEREKVKMGERDIGKVDRNGTFSFFRSSSII